MPKKISDKKIELMRKFYDISLSVAEIARRTGASYNTVWLYTKAKERGFASFNEYQIYLAKQRLNPKTGQPFDSLSDYYKHIAKQRQRRLKNKELSDLIKKRLKKLEKNQSWLARKIDVSREMVSKYAQGKSIPNEERLARLFSTLDVPHRTLDDLLER